MVDRYEIGERADLGVRGADRVARAARTGRLDPADLPGPGRARPRAPRALAAAVHVLDLRLPRAVRGCCATGSPSTRVRDRDRRRASRPAPLHTVRTDRGELRAPLVVDALGWRRVLSNGAARAAAAARLSRGLEVHPRGTRRRARALDRPRLRARRLQLELPRRAASCASAAARSSRATTSRSRPSRSPATSALDAVALPGQLDPPPAARGDRGRRLLRRRLGRPLPAADRRGHPPRVLLRARARPRAARRPRRARDTRDRRSTRYGAFSRAAPRGIRGSMLAAQHLVGRDDRQRAAGGGGAARRAAGASSHWIFGHYLQITPPRPPAAPARPPRRASPPPPPARSPANARAVWRAQCGGRRSLRRRPGSSPARARRPARRAARGRARDRSRTVPRGRCCAGRGAGGAVARQDQDVHARGGCDDLALDASAACFASRRSPQAALGVGQQLAGRQLGDRLQRSSRARAGACRPSRP